MESTERRGCTSSSSHQPPCPWDTDSEVHTAVYTDGVRVGTGGRAG